MYWLQTGIVYRVLCGLLLITQTISRMWITRNKETSDQSRYFHKLRETALIRLAGGAVVLAYLYVFLPDTGYFDFNIPIPLRLIGAGLMLAGDILFIALYAELGRQWSAELEIKDSHKLVTTGIYQWLRHPMYTGFLAFGIGLVLLSANVYGCAYLIITSILIAVRLKAEEDLMIEVFGEEYTEYKARTAALLPGFF